ncbi:MAG TPA: alkaline phosphatase family protein, partial [Ktedonobacteraceae bacterium]|nr:alkaline phosphatase family protein [Ktedonobacteraceae bacterium]
MGKWYLARTAVQRRFAWLIVLSLLLVFAASLAHAMIPTAQAQGRAAGNLLAAPLPRFDHIVVVIEENKDYSEIIGSGTGATYINALAGQGALLTNSHAITHPSQPNYLDLFSGSDQGVNGDACSAQTTYPGPDLGGQLIQAGFSFAGYSENQPSAGFVDCSDSTQLY